MLNPYVVRGVYALYNAEAKVDKLRMETVEFEKSLGTPLHEMSPEDQEAVRELVNEFGQHRDQAKKERDYMAYGFIQAARPVLKLLMDEVLPGALAEIGQTNAKSNKPAFDKSAIEQTDAAKGKLTSSAPVGDRIALVQKAESDMRKADEAAKGKVTEDTPAYASSVTPTSAAEAVDAIMVDQALGINQDPVPMEVDSEKQTGGVPAHISDPACEDQPATTSASVTLTESAHTQQAPNHEQPSSANPGITAQPDAGVAESQSERRFPAVRRLKNVESGLEAVSSTTEELVRKIEKLEEQILYQEEQLNDYLDTRGLMEAQRLDTGSPPDSTTVPTTVASPALPSIPLSVPPPPTAQTEVPTEATAVHPLLPSGLVDMATVEAAREEASRTIDERFEALAKAQDARLAELAQLQETRLLSLGNEIRSEIQAEAARAEEAYAGAVAAAEEKAGLLETQLAKLQAELAQYKEDRKVIEDVVKRQGDADQLLDAIRNNTLKYGVSIRLHDVKVKEAEDQFKKHDARLTELDQRLNEQTTRLTEHDQQISVMSPFEDTKEAWRSDMIDMKNHVVGRVDYLEDQVESIKQPLVAARLAIQTGETSMTAAQRTQVPAPTAKTGQRTRPLTSQAVAPTATSASSTQAPTLPGLPMPTQARASPGVEGITNRLSLNRMAGLSPTSSPAPPAQPRSLPPVRSGFNAAVDRPQAVVNGPFGANPPVSNPARAAWPASSNTPLQTQTQPAPRTNGHRVETDVTPDSALANRLYSSQQPRQEVAQGPLPLHLRMHNGPGTTTGNWVQGAHSVQPVSASSATARQSPVTGDTAGSSLLARMYDPGESKPTPP